MSVRNGLPWVREAIDSLLAQTAPDFELIVIDDGSGDGTADVVRGFRDRRIRLVPQPHRGLTRSLNHALALASAPLVARLDADDRAHPERLARQLAFLDAHPEVGLLGTGARVVDERDREVERIVPPTTDAELRRALIARNPFIHSSVMMRAALVRDLGGYDESFTDTQDYDLWMRMSRVTALACLPDALLLRRLTPGRVTHIRDRARLKSEMRVRWRALRSGAYPWWRAVSLARPALARALPAPLWRRLRRLRRKT
jgi:glycosyltransferase involved in cell wall biosynthesis